MKNQMWNDEINGGAATTDGVPYKVYNVLSDHFLQDMYAIPIHKAPEIVCVILKWASNRRRILSDFGKLSLPESTKYGEFGQ